MDARADDGAKTTSGPGTIARRARVVLAAVGALSWGAGGLATFIGGNGPGAVALIAAGAASGVLALIGRWPHRVSAAGYELDWGQIEQAVDTSIAAAETSDDPASKAAASELRTLRDRLQVLERTGTVPKHPAEIYDEELLASLRRILPGADIAVSGSRLNSVPDFIVSVSKQRLLLETKWRQDPDQPWSGRTLPSLIRELRDGDKLLVVTNARDVRQAETLLRKELPGRARVVVWRHATDDPELARAARSLL